MVNKKMQEAVISFLILLLFLPIKSQNVTDSNTPLHLLEPDYNTPYGIPLKGEIEDVLSRIYNYLEAVTPPQLVDSKTGETIDDLSKTEPDRTLKFREGDFRLISYEWGVTYAGMLLASETTGNKKYADYAIDRFKFLHDIQPWFLELEKKDPGLPHPMRSVLHPRALDDAGAMCAAMIKAERAGFDLGLEPIIHNYIEYIFTKQFRLEDGTLARNRPQPNSLWLDDLFMSVPALAQMGAFTGESKYFDDAINQVLKFAFHMFNDEKGLFMHGWIMGMEEHPEYYWARANGWAIMAMIELLEVLPEENPKRIHLLNILHKQIRALAYYQSPLGFWHQLIDHNDSFLETSATAIYTYAIARAINRGYVDAKVYGPMVCLAWNAVASKVNEKGQVEGTCVGTGMGFDPAFYYYRPVSPFAAHGYGPTLLAGAEMIRLLENTNPKMNDSAIQFYDRKVESDAPIFSVEE
jgi:rhamnogalacturonyl hydrolase YesR